MICLAWNWNFRGLSAFFHFSPVSSPLHLEATNPSSSSHRHCFHYNLLLWQLIALTSVGTWVQVTTVIILKTVLLLPVVNYLWLIATEMKFINTFKYNQVGEEIQHSHLQVTVPLTLLLIPKVASVWVWSGNRVITSSIMKISTLIEKLELINLNNLGVWYIW